MTLSQSFIDKICQYIDYLSSRWQDEYEHEDIKEYVQAIVNNLGVINVKIKKTGANWKEVLFTNITGLNYKVILDSTTIRVVRLSKVA